MNYILYLILGFILYKFITGFVIPVFRASRRIRRQFKQMQEEMEFRNGQTGAQKGPVPRQENKPSGDYIDFEEVK